MRRFVSVLAVMASFAFGSMACGQAISSVFTYQGELSLNGGNVNNTADFQFTLFNMLAGGAQQGAMSPANNVQVVDGVFTTNIDFGFDVFDGQERFLQIAVRSPAGAGVFTPLTPRQRMAPVPYTLTARRGVVPWIVQSPGLTDSVTIDPNASGRIQVREAGALIQTVLQVGGGGGTQNFSAVSGTATSYWGTSGADGSGFASLTARDAGTATIEIDADEDNVADGVEEGSLLLRSRGTGGGGGIYQAANNGGTITVETRGGASGDAGITEYFDPTTGNPMLQLEGLTQGGQIRTANSANVQQILMQPDFDADGGGFMTIDGGTAAGSGSIVLHGNISNSGNPLFAMNGDNSFTVNTNAAGNGSVVMSSDAVSDTEILDEPGVASVITATLTAVTLATTPAITTVTSRSITVPTAGFVLAIGSGQVRLNHGFGTASDAVVGVSDAAGAFPVSQDIVFGVPPGAPTGEYLFPAACQGVFSVTAGAHTFFFLGQETSGLSADVADVTLTLVFISTSYGTVTPTLDAVFRGNADTGESGPMMLGLTPQEILLERAQGDWAHQARIQKELAELRTEVEAMRAEMRNDPNIRAMEAPAPRRTPHRADEQDQIGPAQQPLSSAAPIETATPSAP